MPLPAIPHEGRCRLPVCYLIAISRFDPERKQTHNEQQRAENAAHRYSATGRLYESLSVVISAYGLLFTSTVTGCSQRLEIYSGRVTQETGHMDAEPAAAKYPHKTLAEYGMQRLQDTVYFVCSPDHGTRA